MQPYRIEYALKSIWIPPLLLMSYAKRNLVFSVHIRFQCYLSIKSINKIRKRHNIESVGNCIIILINYLFYIVYVFRLGGKWAIP